MLIRVALSALAALAALSAAPASAAVVPVDPGPVAAGRPILGTTQNLPPMAGGSAYDMGGYPAPTIEHYYASGQAAVDQASITRVARTWVDHWLRDHCGTSVQAVSACKVTVVFDVDETLLSGVPYYVSQAPPFSWHSDTWQAFVQGCRYKPNPAVVKLFTHFRDEGVRVTIISGGDQETQRAYLMPCLERNGVRGWSHYILRTDADADLTAAEWKAKARTSLQRKHGLTVLASIGDQVSDMSHGHLKRGFLLPNPMYYLP